MDDTRYNQILEWVVEKADLGYISYVYAKYLWVTNYWTKFIKIYKMVSIYYRLGLTNLFKLAILPQ